VSSKFLRMRYTPGRLMTYKQSWYWPHQFGARCARPN